MEIKKEAGATLLEMLVGLMLLAILLLMVIVITRSWVLQTLFLKQEIALLDSIVATEDLLRKELETLLFAPYCPSLLPAYSEMVLGSGVPEVYRQRLRNNVTISSPPNVQKMKTLDLQKLQGRGSGHYTPTPVKKLQSLVEGSEILYLIGMKETGLKLQQNKIHGDLPSSLLGLRSAYFYLTDCRHSMLLTAYRIDDGYEMQETDSEVIATTFDRERLQIYMVQEYLIYLQIRNKESFLVVDYMDGQAFYRAPYIVDLNIYFNRGVLQFLLVTAIAKALPAQLVEEEGYYRMLQNSWSVAVWPVLIPLE